MTRLLALLRRALTEARIALVGYRPGDPLSCELCGRPVQADRAVWDGIPLPYCSLEHHDRSHHRLDDDHTP